MNTFADGLITLKMKSPCTYSNIEGKPWGQDVAGKTVKGSIKKIAIGKGYGFKLKYQTPRFGYGLCTLCANVKKRNIPDIQNRLKTQEDYINFYINYISRIIQEIETIEEETEIVWGQIKTKDKENLPEVVQLNEEKIEEIKTITNKEALKEKTTRKENLSEVVESKEEEIAFVRFRLRPIMIDIFKKCFEIFLFEYCDDNQIIRSDSVEIKSYLAHSSKH